MTQPTEPDEPVVVVAVVRPRPEHRDDVRDLLVRTAAAVHPEDGCELYAMHEAEDAFVVVEKWAGRQALGMHGGGEALRRLTEGLEGWTAQDLEVTVARPLPAGDPAKGAL